MTTTFKAGDKVEFVEDYWGTRHIAKGETAVVTQGGGSESLVTVTLDKDDKTNQCFGKRLKRYTPPFATGGLVTPTFKAGDKVRNTGRGNSSWKGVEGVVTQYEGKASWGEGFHYLVKITALPSGFTYHSVGAEVRMTNTNMELKVGDKVRVIDNDFPRPITLKEIQKGDTLRRTITKATGSTITTEGVVVEIDKYGAYDKSFYTTLAASVDDKTVTLELLARPEPEPIKEPEIWENRKVGDQISTEAHNGSSARLFTKIAEDKWISLFLNEGGIPSPGFVRTDKKLGEFLKEGAPAKLIKH